MRSSFSSTMNRTSGARPINNSLLFVEYAIVCSDALYRRFGVVLVQYGASYSRRIEYYIMRKTLLRNCMFL